jgi:signal transduction histidine kinase
MVEEENEIISISVADTGCGIPLEFREKIFNSLGLTTTNDELLGGSGLGLYICQ